MIPGLLGPQGSLGNTPAAQKAMGGLWDDVMAGRNPAYNGEFWRERRPNTHAQKVVDNGIPVLLWTGWHDFTEAGAIRTYVALQNAAAKRDIEAAMSPNQPASPRYQIVITDLGHGEALNSAIILQWMETWVKGIDTGIARTGTPMHLFESARAAGTT